MLLNVNLISTPGLLGNDLRACMLNSRHVPVSLVLSRLAPRDRGGVARGPGTTAKMSLRYRHSFPREREGKAGRERGREGGREGGSERERKRE